MDQPLRIDTTNLPPATITPSLSANFGTVPPQERSRNLSQSIIPSLRISTVSRPDQSLSQYGDAFQPSQHVSQGANKARNESRKLLGHLLGQLQNRPLPPPVLLQFDSSKAPKIDKGVSAVMRSVAGIAASAGAPDLNLSHQGAIEDDDDVQPDPSTFHTDVTFDLMSKLRDVLQISLIQSWDIFAESDSPKQSHKHKLSSERPSSFLRRRSLQPASRSSRSRSPSPSGRGVVKSPELLSQCISVLESVVTNDCRYQISSPRPMRPPFALQAVTIDVAQFLIHAHQHSPKIVSQIGFSMIHAMYSFNPVMHERLLAFFEESVVGPMLDSLRHLNPHHSLTPIVYTDASFDPSQPKPPMVSIQVEEAQEESSLHGHGRRRWSSSSLTAANSARSSTAPEQEVAVYYLSSIVSPLLAAILETIDISSAKLPTIYRFYRFVDRLIEEKPDTYLELLGVVAYHSSRARHFAITILQSYFPKAVGHVVISKPFLEFSYAKMFASAQERGATVTRRLTSGEDPYEHQFVPWQFSSNSRPALFEGIGANECRVCNQAIAGFGLSCPFCMCAVHFDCYDYPDGSFFTEYSVENEPGIQKVAVHRFCHTQPPRRDGSSMVRLAQHVFRFVNIFSLTLCYTCRLPLWGPHAQGLKCGSCRQFVHESCLTDASSTQLPRCRDAYVDSSHVTISWTRLRQSFADHYRDLLFTPSDMEKKSYEEVSVFYAIFKTQLQILDNGIALGSIVIQGTASNSGNSSIDEFELHYMIQLCEAFLNSGKLPVSNTLMDYLSENELQANQHGLYFDWNTLAYIASVIKLPPTTNTAASQTSGLLQVDQPDLFNDRVDELHYPFEVVPLAYLRDQLGDCFNLTSEVAARYVLNQLHHVGFIGRLDSSHRLFSEDESTQQTRCSLPLPIGFDISADVETLVSAIEGCLQDLNLSVNETGFLFLIRRFWPDGMFSDYTFRRLAKVVLSWILYEDDNIATILRDYLAKGQGLPGVRSGLDSQPWPPQINMRSGAANFVNNAGDYVACRKSLLSRYAAPWLLALHDRDVASYSALLFDLLAEHAGDPPITYFCGDGSNKPSQETVGDNILRLITKVTQAAVVFTAFDELFYRWLSTSNIHSSSDGMPSLLRLFGRESESSHRHSTMADSRGTMTDISSLANTNPLTTLLQTAENKNGFEQGIQWLCLFVSSGVDVPMQVFSRLMSLAIKFHADLQLCSLLVKACFRACWLKSLGRQDLQPLLAELHTYLAPQLLDSLQSKQGVVEILTFIRRTLAICLMLYGCERNHLVELEMVLRPEVESLPSRRKLHSRGAALSDPITIDTVLLNVLSTYVLEGVDEISCVIAKFLNTFVNGAPLVESYEIDNFILRNGATLCTCAWQFYGMELPDVATTRTALLLRILVVDVQPLQSLLSNLSNNSREWTTRLDAMLRLFRMVLDVTNPAFSVEDRQWRPSAIDIFYHFFSALWLDDREEVRVAVETWSRTLLPAHLEAIAVCWNEALNKIPISERIKLVSFLLQLHSHFPKWKVMWWDVIIESLLENDFLQRGGNGEDGMAAHLSMYGLASDDKDVSNTTDPELALLQVSLTSLSLRLIADGISVDLFSLLKLKNHVVRVLGFAETSLVSSSNGQSFFVRFSEISQIPRCSFPCFSDLLVILDSSEPMDVTPFSMGGPYTGEDSSSRLLVGTVFVDVVLEIFISYPELLSLPPLMLKNLLKAMMVIIYKHDFDSKPLRHLNLNLRNAVRRVLDLVLEDKILSYESRQLALSVCQSFIKRWPIVSGNFIVEGIEAAVGLLTSLNFDQNTEDILVIQAKSFIEATLSMFAVSGIVNAVFKRQQSREFFEVFRYVLSKPSDVHLRSGTLRESLLRDTLSRAIDNDPECFQLVTENLNTYVEVVYHSIYSSELMQFVGICLTNIARKTADWPADKFNPCPLLFLTCTLIQNNKLQCRDLLAYLESVLLRTALIRFNVTTSCLKHIIQVSSSLYRKSEKADQNVSLNPIAAAIVEILLEALHGKARVTPVTMASLVDAICPESDDDPGLYLPHDALSRIAEGGQFYLHAESVETPSPAAFSASQSVAQMILRVAEHQPLVLGTMARYQMVVRAWNALLLAALSRPTSKSARNLFNHFHAFSFVYCKSLSSSQYLEYESQDLIHFDVSRAYASIKLWLMLARKASEGDDDVDVIRREHNSDVDDCFKARRVWNELWPPFESVVVALETDVQSSNVSALSAATLSSVADLFLFLRQFRSVIALESSSQIALLNRLRGFGRNDAKVNNVLERILTETPPNLPLEYYVGQTAKDIRAEEKLEAAKRQELAKIAPEKVRRTMS